MIEIKFQGRGGQGVVVASEILARACFEAGMYPQCYSLFGGERRGAAVAAFVRVSDQTRNPWVEYLLAQGRFNHLTREDLEVIQTEVDGVWINLTKKAGMECVK